MSHTPYVDRGNEPQAQPYRCDGATLYAFVVRADEAMLRLGVCDRLFNEPSGGRLRFRPASDHVVVGFAVIRRLSSTSAAEPYTFAEREAAVMVPLVEEGSQQFYLTPAWMGVDHPHSLVLGREIYGFPKALGWAEVSGRPAGATSMWLDALVPAGGELVRTRVVEAQRTQPEPGAGWDSAAEAARGLRALFGAAGLGEGLRLALGAAGDLLRGALPLVFLKQLRDAADPRRACYQAVVTAEAQVRAFRGGGLLGTGWTLRAHPSLALGEEPIQPVGGAWLDIDFELGPGRTL
jgi:hypothetical protein